MDVPHLSRIRPRRAGLAGGLLLLLIAGLAAAPPRSSSAAPLLAVPQNGVYLPIIARPADALHRLAFVMIWAGGAGSGATYFTGYPNPGIATINQDGTGFLQLTTSAFDNAPAWSPDGQRLAFASTRDSFPGLYTMRADGSEQALLTGCPAACGEPSWSPDGLSIAFSMAVTSDSGTNDEIFVIGIDGSGLRQLTSRPENDRAPDWSPDGSRIAFESWADNDNASQIYLINADGSGVAPLLATSNTNTWSPDWLPDGTAIGALEGSVAGWGEAVVVMLADGSQASSYTPTSASLGLKLAWSPEQNLFAIVTSSALRVPQSHIFVQDLTRLDTYTTQLWASADAAWQP